MTDTIHWNELRGSPRKNRPLEFRDITDFPETSCVKQLTIMMNKNRDLFEFKFFLNFLGDFFPTRSGNRKLAILNDETCVYFCRL